VVTSSADEMVTWWWPRGLRRLVAIAWSSIRLMKVKSSTTLMMKYSYTH
jgi:hypothetical protein